MTINSQLTLTLDEAVVEVLGLLTGLDLTYDPTYDRYRAVTRMLNRALRANALEHEWSYYADTVEVATAVEGDTRVTMPADLRPRIQRDDAVRLVDADGVVRTWAYFLPREAIHKYGDRLGLWVAYRGDELLFSRPFFSGEAGLSVQCPVMREPTVFELPPPPETADDPIDEVPAEVRTQAIDFFYPDLIVARAAYMYSLTDPVMQPRAQTLEANFKDLMYQVIERDDRNTDSPYENDFTVPVRSGLRDFVPYDQGHPHSDARSY